MATFHTRGATAQHNYPYKGKVIVEMAAYNRTTKKYYKEYFKIERGGPYGNYSTLAMAKKAVDAWERKQYKKDKRKP